MAVSEQNTSSSVGTVIGQSWRSCRDALRMLPITFVVAFAVCLLLHVTDDDYLILISPLHQVWLQLPHFWADIVIRVAMFLSALVGLVVLDIVLASVAVTMHRLILLGEAKSGLSALGHKRTWRFVAYLLLLQTLFAIVQMPMEFSEKSSARYNVFWLIYLGVALVVGVRTMLLFPSVAIDVPSSRWQTRLEISWQQTRGRFGLVVFSCLGAIGPVVLLPVLISLLLISLLPLLSLERLDILNVGDPWQIFEWWTAVLVAFSHVASAALSAAVASWIFKHARDHIIPPYVGGEPALIDGPVGSPPTPPA